MFYLIETKDQLDKFSEYNLDRCFLEVIHFNPQCHHLISPVSLVYLKPFRSRAGFIFCIDHTEGFKLDIDDVWSLISKKTNQIFVNDGKKAFAYPLPHDRVFCLKTAKYLMSEEIYDESKYNTAAHSYFYQRYPLRQDINRLIPISKHYEKCENMFKDVKLKDEWFKYKYFRFYNHIGNYVFSEIERQGITIDKAKLDEHFKLKNDSFSIDDNGKIYTQYNLFTQTGRPSNKFNGINFAGMEKSSGTREFIIPGNDVLVEFDYSSYHLRILCEIIGFEFEDDDIHTSLAKLYFDTDTITEEQYDISKGITFKIIYTDTPFNDYEKIPFISKVREFKDDQWKVFQDKGFVESWISKRPIRNINNKTQILPYLLQNYETERNILILNDLVSYLQFKKTKLILYTYDSFLFDYAKSDSKSTLKEIEEILEQGGYKTSCTYGSNYAAMKLI